MNCIRCNGTKKYFGNGMMLANCQLCSSSEKLIAPSLDKLDRKSKSYKKAIKDIMDINPQISEKEAVKMFDEAYIKE